MVRNRSRTILLISYLVGVALLTAAQLVFPEKYFLDANSIKIRIPDATFQFNFLDSFTNTAYFYKLVGFGTAMPDWPAGFISYSIPFFLVSYICLKHKWEFNFFTSALFFFWNILMAIYMGMYSKEFLAFVFIFFISVNAKSKKGLFLGLFAATCYALFFRIYWLLTVGFFCLNFYLIKSKKTFSAVVVIQLLAAMAVFKLANVATGQFLSEARLTINTDREHEDNATTMINNVFTNNSSLFDWMNGAAAWIILLFPFFLLKTAEIQHVLFLIFQLVNVFLFIVVASFFLSSQQRAMAALKPGMRNQIQAIIAWCLAFSFVQGIFEPDFGSASRHQVILVPMWFILLDTYYKSKKTVPCTAPIIMPSSMNLQRYK